MFCRNCGTELRENSKYCHKCGTAAKKVAATTAVQESVTETIPVSAVVTDIPESIVAPAPPTPPKAEPAQTPSMAQSPKPTQSAKVKSTSSKKKVPVRIKAVTVKASEDMDKSKQTVTESALNEEHVQQAISKEEAVSHVAEVSQQSEATPETIEADTSDTSPAENNNCKPTQQDASQLTSLSVDTFHIPVEAEDFRDTQNEESLYCQSCGAKIKVGVKFCPRCGLPVGLPRQDIMQEMDSQSPSSPVHEEKRIVQKTKSMLKKPWTTKKLLVVGIVALLLIVMLLLSGGEKYASGIVEANNAYGLSTTMTLEEFIEYYNEILIKLLDIKTDLEFSTQCIEIDNPYSVTQHDDMGMIEYTYTPLGSLLTQLRQHVKIAVDTETGHVVFALLRFSNDGYYSITTTDSARNAVDAKTAGIFFALHQGDPDKAADTMELVQGLSAAAMWEKGVQYQQSIDDDLVTIGFRCMTKEYYESIGGPT